MSYFKTFAQAGATSIAVIKEHELDRCDEADIQSASLKTGLVLDSFDIVNHTWSVSEYVRYLNSLTADTILVCSRQDLCEGVKIALQLDSVTYFPKGTEFKC